MSFFDKYPKLKEQPYLVEEMVKNLYATMALEDQTVEESKVREIVLKIIKEQNLPKS
jgi:uncharacterized protein YneF (UPF0154 family)